MEDVLVSRALEGEDAQKHAAVAAKRFGGPLRPIKFAVASTCLLAGVYAIVSDQRYVQSDNAVVTAYMSSVRVPIQGTLEGFRPAVGAHINAGDLLGRIENPRASEERLHDLVAAEREASGEASATRGEVAALVAERERLLGRAALHARAVAGRIKLESAEAEKVLAQKLATLAESEIELARQQQLHDNGIVSQASFDRVLAEHKVALEDVAAQKTRVAVLNSESEAAAHGVFTEPGFGSDVSYSAQRVDEIELQLARLRESSETLRVHADSLHSTVSSESELAGLMHRADLVSPVTGTVWQVQAQNGERLSAGDSVAELIDCKQQFLLAAFPQSELPRLDLQGEARVKLSGEKTVEHAAILSASEQPDLSQNLAASTVTSQKDRMAVVRLAFPSGSSGASCVVGQAVQVMLPKKRSGLFALASWRPGQ